MNLEIIRTKVQVAGWKFRCEHPLGRKWSRLHAQDKFVMKLIAWNVSCFIVLFILSAASQSS